VIFTGLVALITYLFVKRRWFWRTWIGWSPLVG